MPFVLPLGLSTFRVSASVITDVEVNGLPRLPSSVTCFSRLRSLRNLRHPHLCRYLDAVRRKPERLLTVTEAYRHSLADITGPVSDFHWLSNRLYECFSALNYLSQHGLVHACLNPSYIMVTDQGSCKMAAYGLYYVTGWGKDVDFPVADPVYSAPEVFCFSPVIQYTEVRGLSFNFDLSTSETFHPCPLNISSDVWSLGLIFLELIRGPEVTSPLHRGNKNGTRTSKPFATIRILLEGLRCCNEQNPRLSDFLHFGSLDLCVDEEFRKLEVVCNDCLHFDARLRPKPEKVLKHLNPVSTGQLTPQTWSHVQSASDQKLSPSPSLTLSAPEVKADESGFSKAINFLSTRCDLAEVYYYWCLAGGNLDAVWKAAELYSKQHFSHDPVEQPTNHNPSSNKQWSRPPILRIPHYLALMQNEFSKVFYLTENWPSSFDNERISLDPRMVLLPCERLLERIQRIPMGILYPLLLPITRFLMPITQDGTNQSKAVQVTAQETASNLTVNSNSAEQPSIAQLLFDSEPLPRNVGLQEIDRVPQVNSMEGQPVTIKERDVEYQIQRVCLFNRLLNALPATEARLRFEVRTDIPPFLRAQIWSALLGVNRDYHFRERYAKALCGAAVHPGPHGSHLSNSGASFESNGTSSTQEADTIYGLLDEKAANQISVDLPRCHAYDALLASPMGQASLRRVLVATLLMHPGTLEYTQGMDSVAAVFVRLCFPDEALAAACLHALLRSKLSTFFSSDGFTHGLKQFFDVLLRLFAFHNPSLAVNLTEMNVPLVGLTTGWIYTLFAHAMPLDRVELMWDTLIVGPSSLSLFFYLAIFLQLDQQVNFAALGLEQTCTILSNFPEIDLDKCRADALRYALATPVSLTRSSSWAVGDGTEQMTNSHHRHVDNTAARKSVPDSTTMQLDSMGNQIDYGHSAFYARLCSPDAWPEHLEVAELQPDTRFTGNHLSWMTEDPLVPLLDAKDALEHLIRPDCVVIDVRPKIDYAKGCIAGSIYRSPSGIQLILSAQCSSSSKTEENSDWELIDHPSGIRRQARILPAFLVNLMSDEAWKQAAHARRQAAQQQLANRLGPLGQSGLTSAYSGNCPGLILIVGGAETNPMNQQIHSTVTMQLANWLIRQDVDRVCVLKGGMPALLSLPTGTDLLVYPAPYSVNS